MANYNNASKESVLEAIKNSQAVMSTIAKRLGCAWDTAERLCNRWEETRQALKNEGEFVLDLAESTVYKDINNGSVATAKWLLALKGKARGYDPQATFKLDNGEPLNIKFDGMTREEIASADNVELGGNEESTE